MKRLFTAILLLMLTFQAFSVSAEVENELFWQARQDADYVEWNFDKGYDELNEKGMEIFEKAVEEKRKDPVHVKKMPIVAPVLATPELLSFTVHVDEKTPRLLMTEIAGSGETVKAVITHFSNQWVWYLSLQGKGGNALLRYVWYAPPGMAYTYAGSFNHNSTGNRLDFPTAQPVIFRNKKMYGEDIDKMEGRYDSLDIFITADVSGTDIEDINFVEGVYPSVIEKYRVSNIYYRPPEKAEYMNTSLLKLFSVNEDEEFKEFLENLKKEEELRKLDTYDYGPMYNRKTPLKYTEHTLNGEKVWDAEINYTAEASIDYLMTAKIPALKGAGSNARLGVESFVITVDGEEYDNWPMMRVSGTGGDVWFEINQLIPDTSDPAHPHEDPKAVYIKFDRIKDFKDFVIYEDLTRPSESVELIYRFTDENKTQVSGLTLKYTNNLGKAEMINIPAYKISVTGDELAYRSWWPGEYDDEEDEFGKYLDSAGIEWR